MFELPQTKCVRRKDLRSATSSPPPSSPNAAIHARLVAHYEALYATSGVTETVRPATLPPPSSAGPPSPSPPDPGAFTFRLFSTPATKPYPDSHPPQVIIASPSPDPENHGFLRPLRPDAFYFATATPAQRASFQDAAREGNAVRAEGLSRWSGCELPWRVVVGELATAGRVRREQSVGKGEGGRRRMGKKRRVVLRKRMAGIKEREEAARVAAVDKEAAEREKRTRRNREKKVKRKKKGKGVQDDKILEQQEAAKRASSALCLKCLKVELRPEKLVRLGPYADVEWSLGPFKDVLARSNCPFCRLVVVAATAVRREVYGERHEPPFGIEPAEEVLLGWDCGKGFTVNLAMPDCRISFLQQNEGLADEDEEENNSKVPVRRARRIESYLFDTEFLTYDRWLSSCQEEHGDACSPTVPNVSKKFRESFLSGLSYALRFVDVENYCIVNAPEDDSDWYDEDDGYNYVALSYVWGRVNCLRLVTHNQEVLMRRRSLERCWHEIPQTIKDAIRLVRQMGYRYLWVDALCLVQDNWIDMLQGISLMHVIYGGAKLTLIAAAGPHANAGLPSVSDKSQRFKQSIEEIKKGVELTVVNNLDDLLRVSHYFGRAWTLQEQLLANRTLIFTPNGGVYFRCLRAVWSLDTIDDEYPHITTFQPDSLYLALSEQGPAAFSYNTLVMEVTKRDLTNQSDALSVFSGFEKGLAHRMSCSFLAGLPTAAFDFYILFEGHFVTLERRDWFPSWTWAGWKGCTILYMLYISNDPQDLKAWLNTRTWIVWYKRERGQPPSLIGRSEGTTTSAAVTDDSYHETKAQFHNRHCSHIDTFKREATRSSLPDGLYPPDRQLLQFWTLSVHLLISHIDSPNGERHVRERGTIVDRDNEFCGSVRLDGYFITKDDIDKPFEFILLSECKDSMPGSELADREGLYTIRREWDLYWVMLLQRDADGGVAERRGLGQIFQRAVGTSVAPGPCWKEIILG
ncbi:hypothetical protein MMC13_007093 [Lambiella insularis]|nr:hypothetical protein [Lambiella insularis]